MAEPPSRSVRVAPHCPACGQRSSWHLDGVSKDATVDFFDCGTCHHLWAVDKRNQSKVRHVTPFLRAKKDRRSGWYPKPPD